MKRDGTYAANEFIVSNGKEYYLDSEGNKVTGEYVINGLTCYFSKEGVYDVEKNEIHPGKPMIALTFDDGPGLYTEDLLNFFKENDVKGTFFVLGEQVEKFPDVVRIMDEIGCQIGNHTYSHERLTDLSVEDMDIQINKTNEVLQSILGKETQIVRPTYGSVNSTVREHVNYPLIMWSLDTEDWKWKDAKKIVDVILGNVKDGDVVLMHDIHDFTVEAMKMVIPILKEQGFQFVTVSEMAAFKGTNMENGMKYFEF
jgi:peptidoglycan/xylan/chitin deacetylase (PgdA/CDA1 family)